MGHSFSLGDGRVVDTQRYGEAKQEKMTAFEDAIEKALQDGNLPGLVVFARDRSGKRVSCGPTTCLSCIAR